MDHPEFKLLGTEVRKKIQRRKEKKATAEIRRQAKVRAEKAQAEKDRLRIIEQ